VRKLCPKMQSEAWKCSQRQKLKMDVTQWFQVIGWKDSLQNDLQCVEWDVKPYYPPSIPSLFINVLSWSFYMRLTGFREIGGFATLDKVNFFHDFSSNFRLLSMTLGTAVSVWIFILHGLFTMHWFHHPQTRLPVPIPQKQHWHLWNQTGPKYFIFHQTV